MIGKNGLKAIIPVAGYGSRMLPVTKAIEKCMLPIMNRPIIDYIVDDCIRAGVSEIIFVVGEHQRQLKDYYSHNAPLETYLKAHKKSRYLECVQPPTGIKFRYVTQKTTDKYGTAVPVALAANYIKKDSHVLVLMGDDFLWDKKGGNDILGLINSLKNPGDAALIGVPIAPKLVSSYGVIEKDNKGYFKDIVEKPALDKAPSNLINVSKYILPKSLVENIVAYCQKPKEGEYLIIDPINEWVKKGGKMHVYNAKGEYLDGGNPVAWLEANNYIANNCD